MKKYGCKFEYEDERNRALMGAYKRAIAENRTGDLDAVYEAAVAMPSERFWVSEHRAAIVISDMLKGRSISKMKPNKQEMYREIFRRVCELRKKRPKATVFDLTLEVVDSPAPKFYLTPLSAKIIVNKIRRGWYDSRKPR